MAKILIADDEPGICKLYSFAISKLLGLKSESVHDGRSAWKKIKQGGIDILVTDYSMPEMNGLQLATKIRSEKKVANLPIIMASGGNDIYSVDDLAAYVGLGVLDSFLEKPVRPSGLVDEIKKYL